VEQLAPFQNTALRAVLSSYPNTKEIVWLQEEPRNMGAWAYMEPRLRELTGAEITYLGRPERASPAEGALYIHNDEQARIVESAFAPLSKAPATNGSRANSKSGASTEPALSGTGRRRKQ
jgi:2-oxoglutarate dehydrogenase E1 component